MKKPNLKNNGSGLHLRFLFVPLLLLLSTLTTVTCLNVNSPNAPIKVGPAENGDLEGGPSFFQRFNNLTRFPRIIGGGDVTPAGAYPYMVSIQDVARNHLCEGVILDTTTVLTTATCLSLPNLDPRTFFIAAGAHDLGPPPAAPTPPPQDRWVLSFTQHEAFNMATGANDIGLIKVSNPFVFSAGVVAAAPPVSRVAPTGRCTLVGWAEPTTATPPSQTLQFNAMVDISTCPPTGTPAGSFCALDSGPAVPPPQTPCVGFTGTPLICSVGGMGQLAGVKLGDSTCTLPAAPNVFTDLRQFWDWIEKNSLSQFVCTAEGFFSHPDNARYYFYCEPIPHNAFIRYDFVCPAGQTFNGTRCA